MIILLYNIDKHALYLNNPHPTVAYFIFNRQIGRQQFSFQLSFRTPGFPLAQPAKLFVDVGKGQIPVLVEGGNKGGGCAADLVQAASPYLYPHLTYKNNQ